MDDPVFAFPKPASAPASVPDLKSAVRRARVEAAERTSAVAELRGAELARLEMLRDALEPVFAQLPKDAIQFDLGLLPGERPRLFIDMVSFVEMDRDRRTFRFVQEGRAGRLVLAENERLDPVTEAVTLYLGRRLVERERALSGDLDASAATPAVIPAAAGPSAAAAPAATGEPAAAPVAAPGVTPARRFSAGDVAFAAFIGLVIGAAALLLALWLKSKGQLPAWVPLP